PPAGAVTHSWSVSGGTIIGSPTDQSVVVVVTGAEGTTLVLTDDIMLASFPNCQGQCRLEVPVKCPAICITKLVACLTNSAANLCSSFNHWATGFINDQ